MLAANSDTGAMQAALDGKKLPSLPLVVQKLLAAVNAPNTEMRQLAALIEQDAGLAARVLRLANSPFYGLSGEVGSIQQAVVVLGFHAISQLAASVGLMQAIKVTTCAHFDLKKFWGTSLRVAVGARWLAQRRDMNGEHAYLGGLLHDIGLPVAASCFPAAMEDVLMQMQDGDADLLALERANLGFDHLQLGARLAQKWNVPGDIVSAMTQYREPPAHGALSLSDHLHASWHIATQWEARLASADVAAGMASGVIARLQLDAEVLTQLLAELARRTPEIDALVSAAGDSA